MCVKWFYDKCTWLYKILIIMYFLIYYSLKMKDAKILIRWMRSGQSDVTRLQFSRLFLRHGGCHVGARRFQLAVIGSDLLESWFLWEPL